MGELLTGLQIIEPPRHGDTRGWFTETYNELDFKARGIADRFIQDNHSFSRDRWTLRGLHYQVAPHAQAKVVRCIRGRIFDVAVDLRAGSATYGRWCGLELSAENGRQFYLPTGYAHGLLTLEPDCEIAYKVSASYAPDCERGIRWNDPSIGIAWPLPAEVSPLLSAKDAALPDLTATFAAAA